MRLARSFSVKMDEERSQRFIEKAEELGVASPEALERREAALRKIIRPKEPPRKAG